MRAVLTSINRCIPPLVLFLSTFGIYAITAEREAINTDAYAASAGAWRIATAGTPWFDGYDVASLDGTHLTTAGGDRNGQWLSASANGHITAQRMAGPIIFGIPSYWALADGTAPEDFNLLPGGIAASLLAALATTFVFLSVRERVATPLALTAAAAFAFATPTWSVSANGLWTHPVTQVGIAGAAYAASRNRWWLVGVCFGLGMLGRPHVALIAAAVGIGMAWSRRDWRIIPMIGVPTVLSLATLAVWNRIIHGPWSIGGAYTDTVIERAADGVGEELSADQLLNYAGFLVSLDRGFLIWTPAVVLLVPALFRARRTLPIWSVWLALGGILYTFFQLRINHFAGGMGFHGYRHGLELLTCLTPACAFAAPFTRNVARALLPPVIAIQLVAFTLGAMVEGYFVPLEDVWRDNALWLALRFNPTIVGAWLAIFAAIGVWISVRYMPRQNEPRSHARPALVTADQLDRDR